MRGDHRPHPRADDAAREIEVAGEGAGRRRFGSPVDPPVNAAVWRRTEPLAERRLELVPAVAGLERLAVESFGAIRRAEHNRVQPAVGSREIRTKRFVAVPDAEVAV